MTFLVVADKNYTFKTICLKIVKKSYIKKIYYAIRELETYKRLSKK